MGIGLSRLFSASELEDPLIGEDTERANSMGLFLQKTNIIRDYLEDQREGREFWPQEVIASGGLGRKNFERSLTTNHYILLVASDRNANQGPLAQRMCRLG